MALSKRSYTSIQKALQNRAFRVPLNKTWANAHDELGVGNISGKHLILTSEDHTKLRGWVQIESGADPLTTKVAGDRLETASLVRDEKWATEAVFSGMMQVNVISGPVPLTQGEAVTPPGTLLSVAANQILTSAIRTVVIVENGVAARHWHKFNVPPELSTALMVYRGHGSDAETVSQWLKVLPSAVEKIGFFDFDPAGLGMAIDYGVDAMLIPDSLDDELLEGINNKPDSYIDQLERRPALGAQLPEPWRDAWEWMSSDGRKCAITQERMLLIGRKLKVLSM